MKEAGLNFTKHLHLFYYGIITFFIIILAYHVIPYYSFQSDFSFIYSKNFIWDNFIYRFFFYLHITAALIAIIVGFCQFAITIRKKSKKLHRYSGRIYVICVLFLACPSAIYLSFYSNIGLAGTVPFIIASVAWFITTAKGYKLAKNKQYPSHKEWMIRSYSIALVDITFRIYYVIISTVLSLNPFWEYVIPLWLGLIGNIAIGESIIYFKKRRISIPRETT